MRCLLAPHSTTSRVLRRTIPLTGQLLFPHLDAPIARLLLIPMAAQFDDLVFLDISILRDRPLFDHPIMRIVAQARDEETPLVGEPLIPLVIHIPAVENDDRARLEVESTSHLHLRSLA